MSRVRIVNEGDRIGSWTVVEYPYKSRRALVRCDCGSEGWKYVSNLRSGASTRCRKCGHLEMAKTKTDSHGENWKKKRIYYLVSGSSKHNMELTIDDVWRLTQADCYYCGTPPSNTHKYAFGELKYNGIDRIDSSGGYSTTNVRTSCWKCNSAKKEMSDNEFRDWLNKIHEHWQ